jgi:hypothetical protein
MSFTNAFSKAFENAALNDLHLEEGFASSVDFVMMTRPEYDMSAAKTWIGKMALKHALIFDKLSFCCFDDRDEVEYALTVKAAVDLLCIN